MDIWENKNLKPMLIGADSGPFDDPDYLFELKLDGERCLAYLSKDGTELRNKRNMRLLPKFPELSQLHRQVKKNCILDGELAVIKDEKPNFFEVQRRSLLSNQFKIRLAASSSPACFTAFDILYLDGKPVMDEPLAERKKLLGKTNTWRCPGLLKKKAPPSIVWRSKTTWRESLQNGRTANTGRIPEPRTGLRLNSSRMMILWSADISENRILYQALSWASIAAANWSI